MRNYYFLTLKIALQEQELINYDFNYLIIR